ncbi:MAG: hypothetical protein WBN07_05575 [Woeseiaceae bacterium]
MAGTGDGAGRLAGVETLLRLELLTVAVDQADKGDLYAKHALGHRCQPVLPFFRWGVQYAQRMQAHQASCFIY